MSLFLCACGGGGSGGGSSSGGGGSSSGSSSSGSSSSSSGGGSAPPPLTFTLPATISKAADAGVGSNPISEFTVQFSAEPSANEIPGYSYTHRGINNVAFFQDNGSTTRYLGLVYFEDSSDIGPGVYSDTIQIGICSDDKCTSLRAGTIRTIQVTYTVTGTRQPPVAVTASTNSISVQAQSFNNDAPVIRVRLNFQNVRANQSLDITPTATTNGVGGWAYERISETEGDVRIQFKNSSTIAPGTYDDVITVNVCQANKCPANVVGSPITINARYVSNNAVGGTNGYTIRVVNQPATAIIWDGPSAKLYLAVPPGALTHANSVVALDPVTATLGTSTLIGNNPAALAASNDGQFLYVAPRDSNILQRLNLPSLAPSLTIPLGGNASGNFAANEIAVSPGAPNTIAVIRSRLPFGGDDSIAIYDDAIARPNVLTRDDLAIGDWIYLLQWTSPNQLYGLGLGSTRHLFSLGTTLAGPSIVSSNEITPLQWSGDARFDVKAGRVYLSEGTVFDPSTGTILGVLAAPTGSGRLAGVVADPANGRVFALSETNLQEYALHAYDIDTRALIASVPLFGISVNFNSAAKLLRWGTDGLAMATHDGRVVLVNGRFVSP